MSSEEVRIGKKILCELSIDRKRSGDNGWSYVQRKACCERESYSVELLFLVLAVTHLQSDTCRLRIPLKQLRFQLVTENL